MNVIVAISTVSNGSMYNRHDVADRTVIENRKTFLSSLAIDIKAATRLDIDYSRQDFCEYTLVDSAQLGSGMLSAPGIIADALITTDPDHALFLPVADCVGAAFFDPEHDVLAVAHLGRHSLEQSGAHKLVNHLVQYFGSDPAKVKVWLTPAPSKESYPIWALDNKGMKEVTFEQLYAAGIIKSNVTDNTTETDKDTSYFSYSEFLKGNRDEDGDHSIVAMMTS